MVRVVRVVHECFKRRGEHDSWGERVIRSQNTGRILERAIKAKMRIFFGTTDLRRIPERVISCFQ
jgi:hypothetical protein